MLVNALSAGKFYSIQSDARTDCGNIEDDLLVVMYFDAHANDKKVHVRNRVFTVP